MSDPRDTTVNLSGSITATSAASLSQPVFFPALTGRITAAARLGAQLPFTWLTVRVSAAAKLQLYSNRVYLSGRISAKTKGSTQPFIFGPPLYANIYTKSSISLTAPLFTLQLTGRINSLAKAALSPPIPFTGRPQFLDGNIKSATRIRLHTATLYPTQVTLRGRITSLSKARFATGTYTTSLSGRINSITELGGLAGPWQSLAGGIRVSSALNITLSIAEVAAPPPPYPLPFPTHTVIDYLNRITSEHNQKPKYMSTVGFAVTPVVSDQHLIAGVPGLFDLDYCVGEQEDFTGQWIGKSRWIEVPSVFFSWDVEGVGWNQGNWKGPADAEGSLQRLDDYHYRLLLYATVIANHWDGSIPSAYAAWDTLFQYTGIKVLIQDYGNMTMMYGILSTESLDAVLVQLFVTGQMDLRPEGISLIAYAFQPTPGEPFFAWDSSSDSVHGWDAGYWGVMVKPGDLPPVL